MPKSDETVRTSRLTLRPWAVTDAPTLAVAIGENLHHLRPFLPWIADEPLTPEARVALLADFRAQWDAGGDRVYGAFLDGAIVGGSGLHRRAGPSTLEIGYWVHVAHVRRGFATEIAAALTDVAFADDTVDTVEIHHDDANVASRGVPARLGFTMVGRRPKAIAAPGEVGVDCTWAVSRQDWIG